MGRFTCEQVSHCQSGWSSIGIESEYIGFGLISASGLDGGGRGAAAGNGLAPRCWLAALFVHPLELG
jgi:hypothetical protein